MLISNKIVRVEPTTPMISLTWMIGSRCNYDCMYCPSELHDKTSDHPDLEKLKTAWQSFYQKTKDQQLPYKISFTGGEVTANKSFLPLIKFLKNNNFNIGQLLITTNGSASLNYYKQLATLTDAISFSTHSEFIDEGKFFDKALTINSIMIRPTKSFHLNIMDEFWNQGRIELYKAWCIKHNISYAINIIDYEQGTRTYPIMQGTYNLEQV
jgi:sulfatase maturation enzyme AslB (radical SAM superfamily)